MSREPTYLADLRREHTTSVLLRSVLEIGVPLRLMELYLRAVEELLTVLAPTHIAGSRVYYTTQRRTAFLRHLTNDLQEQDAREL
jgi:hypothetical protein